MFGLSAYSQHRKIAHLSSLKVLTSWIALGAMWLIFAAPLVTMLSASHLTTNFFQPSPAGYVDDFNQFSHEHTSSVPFRSHQQAHCGYCDLLHSPILILSLPFVAVAFLRPTLHTCALPGAPILAPIAFYSIRASPH